MLSVGAAFQPRIFFGAAAVQGMVVAAEAQLPRIQLEIFMPFSQALGP
jgi:hypothetical protein